MNQRINVSDLFSREEVQQLTLASDPHGFWAVGSTWAVIVATFATVANTWQYVPTWGKILMIAIALMILAGRQLALAILMHDASHRSLFKTKQLNTILTDWLCARPIWNDLQKYRQHHLRHHAKTSLAEDPDLSLVAGFPIPKASLWRKFRRDLTGITGIKFMLGRLLMDLELLEWTVSNDQKKIPVQNRSYRKFSMNLLRNSSGAVITNLALYLALRQCGHGKLYLLWIGAYLTPFPLFLRIRSMAEHAGMQSSSNALSNTRTTQAGWLARSFVAPIHVNFHQEHHLMATVPYFRLPQLHRLLREKQLVPTPPTYLNVIRSLIQATNKPITHTI